MSQLIFSFITTIDCMKGVNLGGWLLLEKWMTPSLFAGTDAVDEYSFMQTNDAQTKIETHRHTFITEADFEWLARHGIEAVRIPVGYWLFDADGPYTPTIAYVDWAVEMAKKHGIKVLIDMHGAPGSQNGKDHSGRIGKAQWYDASEHRSCTIDILVRIAERYRNDPTVWGVQMLNEPKLGVFQWKLRKFYEQAYQKVADVGRPGLVIVFHDAFTPRLLSAALWPHSDNPAVMDIHWYHFTELLHKWLPVGWYFRKVKRRSNLIKRLQVHQPVIIGEWSMVLSAEALRKRRSSEHKDLMRQHAEIQLMTYKTAAAWFYWSYKTEEEGVWNFRSLVEKGVISLK